jgi:pyridoxal/pyridoxine/pyridoxamine kinase
MSLAELELRYVGNKMATFVMQSLGCDVSAINTVHYSKHASARHVFLEGDNG